MAEALALRVRKQIAEFADVPLSAVMVSTRLEDLKLDSLEQIQLSIEFENEFHIEIPPKEVQNWKQVQDVILYLDRVLKEIPE